MLDSLLGRWALVGLLLSAAAGAQSEAEAAKLAQEAHDLLELRCLKCHGKGPRLRAGLDLRRRETLLAGGDSGPAFDVAVPEKSLFLDMISYRDEGHQMPPSGKLSPAEAELFARWIAAGAPEPATAGEAHEAAVADEPAAKRRGDGLEGWSYRPLRPVEPPKSAGAVDGSGPIDAFIQARLEEAGLHAVGDCDRRSWLRRATYDLLGIAPTTEEIRAFENDLQPGAHERVIERLLANPHYGEKWGRHWLDLVRYAETNGFERDSDKPGIWRYRDWVVDALNQDMPYDRFVREQLAGDELSPSDPGAVTASGYLRLMQWDDEPGAGALQGRYDVLDDIVKTTGQAFLGMTLGCARCHDHKGDPISQEDYYSFMAFFHGLTDMSVNDCVSDVSPPDMRRAYEEARARNQKEEEGLAAARRVIEDDLRRKLAAERRGVIGDLSEIRYRFHRDTFDSLPDFDTLRPETSGTIEGGFLDLAPATRKDAIGMVFEARLTIPSTGRHEFFLRTRRPGRLRIDGVEVIGVETPRRGGMRRGMALLTEGPHSLRLDYYNVGADEFGLGLSYARVPDPGWRYVTDDPPAGFEKPDFDDREWIEGRPGFGARGTPGSRIGVEWTTKTIAMRRRFDWPGEAEDLELALHHDDDLEVWINGVPAFSTGGYVVAYERRPISAEARATLRPAGNLIALRCRQDFGGQYVHVEPVSRSRSAGLTAVAAAFDERPLAVEDEGDRGVDLPSLMKARGEALLGKEAVDRWEDLGRRIEECRKRPLPERFLTPAAQERPGPVEPLHVQVRGNAAVKGAAVEPRFPAVFGAAAPEIHGVEGKHPSSGRRRALAQWITDPANPCFSRVMVNRIWQHHFGRGIVRSSGDFGELGDRPTHPELLDWLASRFRDSGYSVKAMHRLIMSSAAYRRASSPEPAAMEKDPNNDLFWRFDPRRLTAEEIHDSALQAAGCLNPRIGGPSFFSQMPRAVLETSSRPDEVWGNSSEDERCRRALYIKVKRSLVPPLLSVFDVADTDQSCPARFATTQPGQTLATVNGEFMNEQALRIARLLVAESPDDEAARHRSAWRRVLGRDADAEEMAASRAFTAALRQDFGRSALEAETQLALALLNLNEFLYLD